MNVGDLVMNIYTQEMGLITCFVDEGYAEVFSLHQEWLIPLQHLELVNKVNTCKPDT